MPPRKSGERSASIRAATRCGERQKRYKRQEATIIHKKNSYRVQSYLHSLTHGSVDPWLHKAVLRCSTQFCSREATVIHKKNSYRVQSYQQSITHGSVDPWLHKAVLRCSTKSCLREAVGKKSPYGSSIIRWASGYHGSVDPWLHKEVLRCSTQPGRMGRMGWT